MKYTLLHCKTGIISDRTPIVTTDNSITFEFENVPEENMRVQFTKDDNNRTYQTLVGGKCAVSADFFNGMVYVTVYSEKTANKYVCEALVTKRIGDSLCIYPADTDYMKRIAVLEKSNDFLVKRITELTATVKHHSEQLSNIFDGYDID